MSGTSPVVATPMDRLQNHVTGSLLLNMIENTAKLNKKTTSSSSISREDLKALQTKVNQMSSAVTQASADANDAKFTANSAVDFATQASSEAQDALTGLQSTDNKVSDIQTAVENLSTTAVLKNPAEGASQTINGELAASDFKSGDVSLKDLAGNVVLKSTLNPQTISSNLTVNGNTTIGNTSTPANLTVNGSLSTSGNISTIGNITIKSSSNETAMLTSQRLTTKEIYSTTSSSEPMITFDVSKTVKMNGNTTIGISASNPANLTVTGSINILRLNISYNSSTGVVTFKDSTLGKSAEITLT